MRKSKFNESEQREILRLRRKGKTIAEICKLYDISMRTFYTWQKRHGFREPPASSNPDAQNELEQYKQMVAEQRFEISLLRKMLDKYGPGGHNK